MAQEDLGGAVEPPVAHGARPGAKGKGKGKDAKGQGKGPLYRGGPAPDQDEQDYVDRWGRTRQYRDYKGGSMQSEETLPTACPNKSLARPAGWPLYSACLCVSLIINLNLLDRTQVRFQEPTPTHAQTNLLAVSRLIVGGCPAPPLTSNSMHRDRAVLPQPLLHMQERLLTGTTGDHSHKNFRLILCSTSKF